MNWICIHKWSKWSALVPAFAGVHQYRYCEKCNMVKLRRAGCGNNFNLTLWNLPEVKP